VVINFKHKNKVQQPMHLWNNTLPTTSAQWFSLSYNLFICAQTLMLQRRVKSNTPSPHRGWFGHDVLGKPYLPNSYSMPDGTLNPDIKLILLCRVASIMKMSRAMATFFYQTWNKWFS